MKKLILLFFLFGFLCINLANAIMPFSSDLIIEDVEINLDKVKEFGTPDESYILSGDEITYRSHFNNDVLITISNNDLIIKIPKGELKQTFTLSFDLELKALTNEQILEFVNSIPEKYDLRDYDGGPCKDEKKDDEVQFNNRTGQESVTIFGCMLKSLDNIEGVRQRKQLKVNLHTTSDKYNDELEAKNEIKSFLSRFNFELPEDVRIFHSEKREHVINIQEFDWKQATKIELIWLEEIGVLNLDDQNIRDLSSLASKSTVIKRLSSDVKYYSYYDNRDNEHKKESISKVESVKGNWYVSKSGSCSNYVKDDTLVHSCTKMTAPIQEDKIDARNLESLSDQSINSKVEKRLEGLKTVEKISVLRKIINWFKNIFW